MGNNHEEYKTHIAIVKHHSTAFPHVKLLYIPNAVRDSTDAFFNKMMGAVPGAHDLMLFWGKPLGAGIFEVKSRTGKLSSQQNKFASAMASLGVLTGYGSSVRSYHDTLIRWGCKPAHNAITEPDYRTKEEKFRDAHNLYRPQRADVTTHTTEETHVTPESNSTSDSETDKSPSASIVRPRDLGY